jgi:hypothetical protein
MVLLNLWNCFSFYLHVLDSGTWTHVVNPRHILMVSPCGMSPSIMKRIARIYDTLITTSYVGSGIRISGKN